MSYTINLTDEQFAILQNLVNEGMETILSPYDNINLNEDQEEHISKILSVVTFFNSHNILKWLTLLQWATKTLLTLTELLTNSAASALPLLWKKQTKLMTMTLTERNQKLYELRESLLKARAQVAWIEQEIWLTNQKYKNQDLDLYKEMFGDDDGRGQDSAFMDDNFGG